MKSTILIALTGSTSAAWQSWGPNPNEKSVCPQTGFKHKEWKLERHTWRKHGDVCRATDGSGSWQPPNACTSSNTRLPRFHLAPIHATKCDRGKPATKAQCLDAVLALRKVNGVTKGRTTLAVGISDNRKWSWGGVPKGCSTQAHEVSLGKRMLKGDWGAHFSKGGKGAHNNGLYQVVCTGAPKKCPTHTCEAGTDQVNTKICRIPGKTLPKVVGLKWTDAKKNVLVCPAPGTYGHTWTLERHTSTQHGDVCRGQGGHWQPPTGCNRGSGCTTHSCMAGEANQVCRVPGAPKPTVCPADGTHGHVWSVEDHSRNKKIGDLCRGQNGHWFPPVNCQRYPGPPYAVFSKTNKALGHVAGRPCRVPKDIYKAGVAVDLLVCENQKFEAKCPFGSVVKIVDASFGREIDGSKARHGAVCPGAVQRQHVGKCSAADAKKIVAKKCDGSTECEILAANDVFGDPCHGTKKYLNVHYECETMPEIEACDASNCKTWDCQLWCECYDEADEKAGVYASHGCLDDGSDDCDCTKVQPNFRIANFK